MRSRVNRVSICRSLGSETLEMSSPVSGATQMINSEAVYPIRSGRSISVREISMHFVACNSLARILPESRTASASSRAHWSLTSGRRLFHVRTAPTAAKSKIAAALQRTNSFINECHRGLVPESGHGLFRAAIQKRSPLSHLSNATVARIGSATDNPNNSRGSLCER